MKPAILDIEASGFGKDSYPIEIGLVLTNGDAYSYLVQPEDSWTYWDERAEQVHGISRVELEQKGRQAWDIASQLNTLLQGIKIYSDAWAHDYVWLNQLFTAAKLIPGFRFDSTLSLLNEEQINRWNSEKERQFSMATLPRHRAATDAQIIQNTLLELTSVESNPEQAHTAKHPELSNA